MENKHMTLRTTALLLALAFSTAAVAGPTGNIAAGKAKAQPCAACHGADGNKTLDGTYPKIGGQYPDYLAKVLHEYKSGKRKNPIMAGQAQALSEQDIANLAAYFGSLKSEVHDLSGHAR
ncbi:MAG: cytochrome c [Arenimonas sp.]|jgi:cytochrome c553